MQSIRPPSPLSKIPHGKGKGLTIHSNRILSWFDQISPFLLLKKFILPLVPHNLFWLFPLHSNNSSWPGFYTQWKHRFSIRWAQRTESPKKCVQKRSRTCLTTYSFPENCLRKTTTIQHMKLFFLTELSKRFASSKTMSPSRKAAFVQPSLQWSLA